MRENRRLQAQFSHPLALLTALQPRPSTIQLTWRRFRAPTRLREACVSRAWERWCRLRSPSCEAKLRTTWFPDSTFYPFESRAGDAIYTSAGRIGLAYSRLPNAQY